MSAPQRSVLDGAQNLVAGRSKGRARRTALRLILFGGYAALASVALLEFSVRVLLPQPMPQPAPEIYRPDPEIGWRRNPDVRITANTGERDVEICTDGQGDRVDCGREPEEAVSCRARILVLGDSFVEALAIPFGDTAWSRIEKATGACTAVAGVGGYGPQQYARLARERLASDAESFDLVILNFYAGNDFTTSDAMPGPTEVERPRIHLLPGGLSLRQLWNWLYPYNQWLESRSHLYVAGRYSMMRILGYDDVRRYGIPPALLRSELSELHLRETTRIVERIANDTHAARARLLVNVIPIVNQVIDPQGESLRSRSPALRDDFDMNLVSDRFVPRISTLPDVDRVVDLLPYLRAHADQESWGRRDRHFSPSGHELWFEAMREPIEQLLAKP